MTAGEPRAWCESSFKRLLLTQITAEQKANVAQYEDDDDDDQEGGMERFMRRSYAREVENIVF